MLTFKTKAYHFLKIYFLKTVGSRDAFKSFYQGQNKLRIGKEQGYRESRKQGNNSLLDLPTRFK